MKPIKRNILLFLICCGVMLTATQAFSAATGFEDDAGGPQGLAIQGEAPGEKLTGVVFIEAYNQLSDCTVPLACLDFADIRAVVRLRKAQNIVTFYAEVRDVQTNDPLNVQMAIMNVLATDIKNEFFNKDQNVILALRTAEEFGSVDITRDTLPVSYVIADIVIAGK